MLTTIHPKLPMRNKAITRKFYIEKLGFKDIGLIDYPGYLILQKDHIEIHFFEFNAVKPEENYGQVYIRTNAIEAWYQSAKDQQLSFSGSGRLEIQPWGQREFSLLDPDHNLLTFGEAVS